MTTGETVDLRLPHPVADIAPVQQDDRLASARAVLYRVSLGDAPHMTHPRCRPGARLRHRRRERRKRRSHAPGFPPAGDREDRPGVSGAHIGHRTVEDLAVHPRRGILVDAHPIGDEQLTCLGRNAEHRRLHAPEPALVPRTQLQLRQPTLESAHPGHRRAGHHAGADDLRMPHAKMHADHAAHRQSDDVRSAADRPLADDRSDVVGCAAEPRPTLP